MRQEQPEICGAADDADPALRSHPSARNPSSNGVAAGFQSSAFGFDGCGVSAWTLCVAISRRRSPDSVCCSSGIAAVDDGRGSIEALLEKRLIALDEELGRHDAVGVRQHAVGRHDGHAFDAVRGGHASTGSADISKIDRPTQHKKRKPGKPDFR